MRQATTKKPVTATTKKSAATTKKVVATTKKGAATTPKLTTKTTTKKGAATTNPVGGGGTTKKAGSTTSLRPPLLHSIYEPMMDLGDYYSDFTTENIETTTIDSLEDFEEVQQNYNRFFNRFTRMNLIRNTYFIRKNHYNQSFNKYFSPFSFRQRWNNRRMW